MTRTARARGAMLGLLALAMSALHAAGRDAPDLRANPAATAAQAGASAPRADDELPARLADTGLYAPGSRGRLAAGVLEFTPQYPLWSDGARKRRWVALPPGGFIDAAQVDAWQFPPGTRLWKEFALAGKPVETRFIERRGDGSWRFAAYLWNDEGTEAVLAPAQGVAAWPVAAAPGGHYAVPSREDCLACHGSAPVPVLGFSALQLSPDRDPLAANAQAPRADQPDLRTLVASGLLRHLPPRVFDAPPRIAAATPLERAALGTLHGNCGHCHNRGETRVPLRLTLAQRAADPAASRDEVRASILDAIARYQPSERDRDARIVAPGHPDASVLVQRMRSRDPRTQMPPLGTALPDAEGLALVRRWIASEPSVSLSLSTSKKEISP